MSQVKAPPTPTPVQPPHATSHGQPQALSPPTRITTRRSSRSAHSTMATNNNSKDSAHDSSSTAEEVTSPESTTSGVTTRSKSMDTQATKDTPNPPDPIQQDTKKKTNTSKLISLRKRSAKQSSASPTTPIPSSVPTLRASKASSTRAAKRIDALAPRASVRRKRKEPSDGHAPDIDAEHKRQRLAELDDFEKSILDGSHPEYQEHMNKIQKKRQDRIAVAEGLYKYQVQNYQSAFEATKKAAFDRFYEQKRNLRLKLIHEIQTKIKLLEQEFNLTQDYETYASDDEDRQNRLIEWVPPSRHASIYSEPIGLSQQEIDSDLDFARRKKPSVARKLMP